MASSSQMKVSVVVDLVGNLASKARQMGAAMTQMSARSRASLAAMRGSIASTSAAIDSAGNRMLMGAVGAGYAFNKTFVETARQAERYKLQMDALFGKEGSAKAMAWAKQNAKDTVLSLDDVISATAKLKAYGADPVQLLPTLENEAAMRGMTGEQFANVTDAIGKMWADGQISDEYNDVLMNSGNGLSMIALLQKATGKSQAELKELMSKKKLGMDAIRLALKQMEIESRGASAAAMGGLNGMISNASDNWEDFQRRLMDSGVTDELKAQFKPLLEEYDKAAESGSLDNAAKSGAQTIIRIIREASAAARGLYSTFTKVIGLLDKGAQLLGGWENTAKIIAGIWAANKALRVGGAVAGVGKGAFNIGRGAWTMGAGGVKAGARGLKALFGRGGKGNTAGIQLPAIGEVQQVFVTNWPVGGVGYGADADGSDKKSKKKRAGRGRKAKLGRAANAVESMATAAKASPVGAITKGAVAATTAAGAGGAAGGIGKTAMKAGGALLKGGARAGARAIPVAGAVLAVAEVAQAENAEQAAKQSVVQLAR
ncbi:TPA: tape measure protein [Escherichia coli]|nr:tape measure protein [Escherichia coli]